MEQNKKTLYGLRKDIENSVSEYITLSPNIKVAGRVHFDTDVVSDFDLLMQFNNLTLNERRSLLGYEPINNKS